MHRSHANPLIRQMLLLSALLVGSAATLFVPPYREIAAAPDEDQPVSAQATPDNTTGGVTGIDVNLRQLELVRSTI